MLSNTGEVQLALGCFTWWRISLLFSICPERNPIGQEISGCFFPGRERNTSPRGETLSSGITLKVSWTGQRARGGGIQAEELASIKILWQG